MLLPSMFNQGSAHSEGMTAWWRSLDGRYRLSQWCQGTESCMNESPERYSPSTLMAARSSSCCCCISCRRTQHTTKLTRQPCRTDCMSSKPESELPPCATWPLLAAAAASVIVPPSTQVPRSCPVVLMVQHSRCLHPVAISSGGHVGKAPCKMSSTRYTCAFTACCCCCSACCG